MRLRRAFLDFPIRRKVRVAAMLAAGTALLLACGSFLAYDAIAFRDMLLGKFSTEAEILARQTTSALVFDDPDAARQSLAALAADPHLRTAAIYTADGALFASYGRHGDDELRPPGDLQVARHSFAPGHLVVVRPIHYDQRTIGAVVIDADLTALFARLQRYALISVAVLLASFLAAHWTAARMQGLITSPVQQLAATADAVAAQRDYSVRATVVSRDEIGQLVGAFNHMLDQIQERERALSESEGKYRLLFEDNPNPMWVYDPATLAFLAVNDAATRLYGFSQDEFAAMTIKDVRPPEDVPRLLARLAEPAERRSASDGPWRHRRKDGTLIEVEITSTPIAFGGFAARLVLAADVTEKRRLESQLLQSQKMEAVGRLAGGVAHDFNNLLGVITGYSELLQKSLAPQDPARRRLEQIQKAADRAANLTRQLLAFSRKDVVQPQVLDLNEVVSEIEKMLRRLIGEDVELVTRPAGDLGRVRADRGQIEQIVVNLAVNARDAMPDGGTLWIETANADLDEAYVRAHAGVPAGRYVLIAVSDTGHGMDAATAARVFEPFFTTKPPGKGTGLGLSTVFGIVSQVGGHVGVYSEPGHGATFKVYLPRVDAPGAPAAATVVAAPPRGTETVLLVEDAEALRPLVQEILEAAGYHVIDCADPADAMVRAGSLAGPLDLVLTDVIMPGMSGPDLVKALRASRPEIKALFMSGYTDDAIGRQGVLAPGIHFLQKPFTSDRLLGAVRAALDGSAEGG